MGLHGYSSSPVPVGLHGYSITCAYMAAWLLFITCACGAAWLFHHPCWQDSMGFEAYLRDRRALLCVWTWAVILLLWGWTKPMMWPSVLHWCAGPGSRVFCIIHTVWKWALAGRPTALCDNLCLKPMVPLGSQLRVCWSLPDPESAFVSAGDHGRASIPS